ncbi:putative uncharacterized protein [Firmicutes bacterium CAG:646]|nr:putative uncharacterized protein [Firmicutes bacterium CAG:646]
MQFDQSFPFYMPYPIWMPFEQEREQEKDREVMKSYYSRRAAMIQEKVERECDRMEYDGSMMFDEYPDKFMMEHLCGKIEKELLEEEQEEMKELEMQNRRIGNDLRDLIGVLLFNEMYRRRCRHRRCRRYF